MRRIITVLSTLALGPATLAAVPAAQAVGPAAANITNVDHGRRTFRGPGPGAGHQVGGLWRRRRVRQGPGPARLRLPEPSEDAAQPAQGAGGRPEPKDRHPVRQPGRAGWDVDRLRPILPGTGEARHPQPVRHRRHRPARHVHPEHGLSQRTGSEPPFPFSAFPNNKKQVDRWIRHDNWQRRACRTGENPITNHMSTADTARDMDLIRQAVGDDKLTYYGISYGSYLGATYAAMFPDNVRAMIIDGVLDPVAWATGRGGSGTTIPFSTRLKSGYGAAEALTSALARCDELSRRRCALSGSATETWNDLVRRLRKGPVKLDGGVTTDLRGPGGSTRWAISTRPSPTRP